MLNFKPKTTKKILQNVSSQPTLDLKHSEMIQTFKNEETNDIPKLQQRKKELKDEISKCDSNLIMSTLKEELHDITIRLNRLNEKKKRYYLDNARYIFDYFEKKKDVSSHSIITKPTTKSRILDSFFKIPDAISGVSGVSGVSNYDYDVNTHSISSCRNTETNILSNLNASSNAINQTQTQTQTQIQTQGQTQGQTQTQITKKNGIDLMTETDKYFMNISDDNIDLSHYIDEYEKCASCMGEMIILETDGIMICNRCSVQVPYLIEHEKPSYKEPPKEVCFYAYKKLNHFKEILAQVQAKESTQIPDIVFENLKKQIKKERIKVTADDLTHSKTKDLLKKLGYNKYYEHISFIKDKLGIKPPVMSLHLEEKLINMFLDTQKPYAKYCPPDRLNFLNYYYVLYKLCEILGENQYLQYCPMLKDDEKLIEQDEIWQNICCDLGWVFFPTKRVTD